MLKTVLNRENSALEALALAKLRELLKPVPFVRLGVQSNEPAHAAGSWRPDFSIDIQASEDAWVLVCEVKADGQPRNVRGAALQLRDYVHHLASADTHGRAYPVIVAPYISLASAEICKEASVGFADLAGNCHLAFDRVYIERSVAENPFRKRRVQRSLFAAKSARVLRLLLAEPNHVWRVAQLAEQAQVSLGQVSNLRQRLLDEEWAVIEKGGLRLSKPRELLDAWRQAHRLDPARSESCYTLLHGEALDKALRAALAKTGAGQHAVLASYSAARWLAPFARVASLYVYADEQGEAVLRTHLKLEPPGKGANVLLMRPKDEGVFLDRFEAAKGIWCTSPIQTYLDLAVSGERGAEAAEHLFNECIAPSWKAGQ
jgi:Transcriptional regulator, AbiEi antitoxin, Type IV TA system